MNGQAFVVVPFGQSFWILQDDESNDTAVIAVPAGIVRGIVSAAALGFRNGGRVHLVDGP